MRSAVVVIFALLVGGTEGGAQLPDVTPGARVRLDARTPRVRRMDGTVLEVTADTVVVARDGWNRIVRGDRTVRLPVANITRLDLYRGQDRNVRTLGKFALLGAGTGTLVGLYTGATASGHSWKCTPGAEPECVRASFSDRELTRWALGSAGAGALTFALVAAIRGEERWERRVPSRAALAPVPGGVGVRIAFGGP